MDKLTEAVKWNADNLVCAIAQDHESGRVLMVAYMNPEALRLTVQSGFAHYYSRSRQKLWRKGEQSGHLQKVRSLRLDCDGDAVLMQIEQQGGIACHTGRESCFYRQWDGSVWQTADAVLKDESEIYRQAAPLGDNVLSQIQNVLDGRRHADPSASYVAGLLQRGEDKILKKVIEEAGEVLMASKDGGGEHLIYESADLWFHNMILLTHHGLRVESVLAELARRQGLSGLAEKAARAPEA